MKKSLIIFFILSVSLSIRAQQKIGFSLTVNDELSDTVYSDQPVLLLLRISNIEAQKAFGWNLANKRRADELKDLFAKNKITKEAFEKESRTLDSSRKIFSPIQLGSESRAWYEELKWNISDSRSTTSIIPVLLPYPETDRQLLLDENSYFNFAFGIPAETIAKLEAGKIELNAVLGSVKSNKVQLIITGKKISASLANREETILKEASYFTHAADGEQMLQLAKKLLLKDSVSIDGLVLKADAYVFLKNYDLALETYSKALEEYYKQFGKNSEPPEYIMASIFQLKNMLGK